MLQLTVDLGARSYPIHIGAALLARPELFATAIRGEKVLIITNDRIAPLYLQSLLATLANHRAEVCILPDGEQYKTVESAMQIWDRLIAGHHDRGTTLLALGGGVIGDLTGFAAACYQRGVDFVQVPTTLLAQVDSSVGGKTGVNHPQGKNMIGAFHQPRAVIIDTNTLNTLAPREFSAGLAEVIKYGLLGDVDFFGWLEANMEQLMARDPDTVARAIEHSCRAKALIVMADETEQGQRALLNLGHTFGHAIESVTNYRRWLHGEAVAMGLVMAADLSRRLGMLDEVEVGRIKRLLQRAGLPSHPTPDMQSEALLAAMQIDKKVQGGKLRVVVMRGIGSAELLTNPAVGLLRETISAAIAGSI